MSFKPKNRISDISEIMELDGKRFWVTDPEHGFKLGKLVDIGSDTLTIEPFDTPGKVSHRFYSP